MQTGKATTIKVKQLLNEARESGKNLYCAPIAKGFNPIRIISVKTWQGLTVANTITGGTIPVTEQTLRRMYVQ